MKSLFVDELDGFTFATREDFFTWEDAQREDTGPTWSYYGGWVN